tara:strand:+ start:693 stop:1064 length:372 start_codon:yes stop_codon:yes gene_type:complete
MPLLQDLATIGQQISTNLFGDLKGEYEAAAIKSAEIGSSQPLIDFYNKNETKLSQQYGVSLNQVLGVSQQGQQMLTDMGTPMEQVVKDNEDKSKSTFKRIVLPLLGIIAGGAAIVILFKTLKK